MGRLTVDRATMGYDRYNEKAWSHDTGLPEEDTAARWCAVLCGVGRLYLLHLVESLHQALSPLLLVL